jgi:hypothetical protein
MATSATSITASGKTGGICSVSGPYKSGGTTPVVIYFKRNDKFPVDPVSGRATTWTMVRQ